MKIKERQIESTILEIISMKRWPEPHDPEYTIAHRLFSNLWHTLYSDRMAREDEADRKQAEKDAQANRMQEEWLAAEWQPDDVISLPLQHPTNQIDYR